MQKKLNLQQILTDSLYYPACDIDGGVIKYCNEHYDKFGINSYVYADYDSYPTEVKLALVNDENARAIKYEHHLVRSLW